MSISFKLNPKAFATRLSLYGPLCAVTMLVTSLMFSRTAPKYTGICLEQHQAVLNHDFQSLYWFLGIFVVVAMLAFLDIVTCIAVQAKKSMDEQHKEGSDENQPS